MPTRARAPRRHPVVALLVVLALAVLSVAGAQAAGLSLMSPVRPTAKQLARCAPGPVTVSPTGTSSAGQFTQVAVSGLAGGCTIGAVRVASGSTGAWTQAFVSSSSSAITGGAFTATGPAFTPPVTGSGRAWVTVNGWPVPATWAYTPPAGPVSPGNGNTVMPNIEWTLVTNNPVQVCFTATVSTTSTTPVPWQLKMDLAQAPFNGTTSQFALLNAPGGADIAWKLGITYDHTAMTALIAGKPDVDAPVTTITSATTLRFQVCNYNLPPGVQTPSAYTVTYSNSPAWTATRACVTATVTGNGTSRFFFGWTAEIDMSAARAAVGGSGWSELTDNFWQLTRTDLGGNKFRFTSNTAANISGTQTYVFTYCATR